MSLDKITAKAGVYAEARERLAAALSELKNAQEALLRDHLPTIKRHLRRASEHESELRALVEAAPQYFDRPRTIVMHGLKVGFAKGKGKVIFTDADKVVRLIEKKLPDLADVLIDTTKAPSKAAIAQLTTDQLKSIGCEVTGTGDVVLVRAVDAAVDKLVTAMLKSLGDDAQAEAEEAAA